MSRNQAGKSQGTIVIDGIRYHSDRPCNCELCSFWKNRKRGCVLGKENCYYLVHAQKKETRCDGCPYCRDRTCVSAACYRDLMAEFNARSRNSANRSLESSPARTLMAEGGAAI